MDKIKVSRQKLLVRISENLEQHKKDFTEALEAWRHSKLSELEAWSTALQNNNTDIPEYTALQKPSSHVKDYECAIDMYTMSVEDDIELSVRDFRQYVRDEWDWKQDFEKTKMFYASQQH